MKESHEHPLLEREDEMSAIEAALGQAARGQGGCLTLEGLAGVGKTLLLETARREAQDRGFRVLSARAGEREQEYSWGVARSLFEPLWLSADGTKPDQNAWADSASACRSMLVDGQLPEGGTADSSFAIFSCMLNLVRQIASTDHPLLLAVDDLHWVDGSSVGFLEFTARRIDDIPLLLLTTLRSGEPGADTALITSLTADSQGQRVFPQPLSRNGSAQALRARLGDKVEDELLDECHQVTGGNPLLLSELARAIDASERSPGRDGPIVPRDLVELGPKAVGRTVEVRLARTGEPGRQLAAAAAILGEDAQLGHAVQLAGLEPSEANQASIDLARLEVITPGSRIHFIHPVVRAAIYDGIGAPERERLHRAAASILGQALAPPEQIAGHLLKVDPNDDQLVVATLRQAAIKAAAGGDSRSATLLMRRAIAEPPDDSSLTDCLAQLGAAEMLIDGPAAVEHLRAALARIEAPPYYAAVGELLARTLILQEQVPEAITVCESVLSKQDETCDPGVRRRMEAVLVETTMVKPQEVGSSYSEKVEELLTQATDLGDGDYGSTALLALSAISGARDLTMTAEEAIRRSRLAAASGVLIREGMNSIAQLAPAQGMMMAGRHAEAIALLDRALEQDERYGSMLGYLSNLVFRGRANLFAGNLRPAIADAEEAMRASEAYGVAPGVAWSSAIGAEALLLSGDVDGAAAVLDRQLGQSRIIPEGWHWLGFMATQGRIWLERGDPEKALIELERAGQIYERHGGAGPTWLTWRPWAAEALVQLGRIDEARELVDDELERAQRWGANRQIGTTLAAKAKTTEDGSKQIDLLEEAVSTLDRSEGRLDLATALIDLGAALRRANRKADSRVPLRRGMDLAQECGAGGSPSGDAPSCGRRAFGRAGRP